MKKDFKWPQCRYDRCLSQVTSRLLVQRLNYCVLKCEIIFNKIYKNDLQWKTDFSVGKINMKSFVIAIAMVLCFRIVWDWGMIGWQTCLPFQIRKENTFSLTLSLSPPPSSKAQCPLFDHGPPYTHIQPRRDNYMLTITFPWAEQSTNGSLKTRLSSMRHVRQRPSTAPLIPILHSPISYCPPGSLDRRPTGEISSNRWDIGVTSLAEVADNMEMELLPSVHPLHSQRNPPLVALQSKLKTYF